MHCSCYYHLLADVYTQPIGMGSNKHVVKKTEITSLCDKEDGLVGDRRGTSKYTDGG